MTRTPKPSDSSERERFDVLVADGDRLRLEAHDADVGVVGAALPRGVERPHREVTHGLSTFDNRTATANVQAEYRRERTGSNESGRVDNIYFAGVNGGELRNSMMSRLRSSAHSVKNRCRPPS